MKRPADLAPWLPTWAWILVGALQLLGGVGFAGLTGSGPWCERQGWDRIMAAVSLLGRAVDLKLLTMASHTGWRSWGLKALVTEGTLGEVHSRLGPSAQDRV